MSDFHLVIVPSVISKFLDVCPAFRPRWEQHLRYWRGEPSGDYNDMAELAHFVVEAYERGDASCLPAIFQLAEEFLLTGHPKQKEIITLGLLEDIQTISSHHDFGPDVFVPSLGLQSRAAWEQIARTWEGKHSLMDVVRVEAKDEKPPKILIKRCGEPPSIVHLNFR